MNTLFRGIWLCNSSLRLCCVCCCLSKKQFPSSSRAKFSNYKRQLLSRFSVLHFSAYYNLYQTFRLHICRLLLSLFRLLISLRFKEKTPVAVSLLIKIIISVAYVLTLSGDEGATTLMIDQGNHDYQGERVLKFLHAFD